MRRSWPAATSACAAALPQRGTGARSGGLCVYRATKGNPGDASCMPSASPPAKDADVSAPAGARAGRCRGAHARGSTVIGLASFRQLAALEKMDWAKAVRTALMDNYAPPA